MPLLRHVFFGENGADRASGHASTAVDTLVGVNIELVVRFVDAFNGTDVHAGFVLGADARFGNDVWHEYLPN